MSASRLPLSVVVIALNEAPRIGDCLASVQDLTDDIVVVDAHSHDYTCEICRSRGARVFQRAWIGYSEQKNFGNAQARHDWILSLDADERITAPLAVALSEEFARGPRCDAYGFRFENYFGAKRVRFGAWNPEWHVRLFDRRKFEWDNARVHEGLRGDEGVRVGRLSGCIRHQTVESHADLANKTERYASLFAAKKRQACGSTTWCKVWLNPVWRFVRDYFVRFGVLDGKTGAIIAWEAARYTHLKYLRAQPVPRPMRLLDWLTLAGGCALFALIVTRVAAPGLVAPSAGSERFARATMTATAMRTTAVDDDDDEPGIIAPDSDDDVVI